MDNYPEPGQIRSALLRQLIKDIDAKRLKGASVTKVEVIPKGSLFKEAPSEDELSEMDPEDLKGVDIPRKDIRDETWTTEDTLDGKSPEEIAERFGTGSEYMDNLRSNKALRKWQDKQDTMDIIKMREDGDRAIKANRVR